MDGPKELLSMKYGSWRTALEHESFDWSSFLPKGVLPPPSVIQPKGSIICKGLATILGLNWHLGLFYGEKSYLTVRVDKILKKYTDENHNYIYPSWSDIYKDVTSLKNKSGNWSFDFRVKVHSSMCLKESLLCSGPLLVSIDVDDEYNNHSSATLSEVPPSFGPQGSHAVVLIGWVGECFIIHDNKGSTWGTDGYALVNPLTRRIGGQKRVTFHNLELSHRNHCACV